MRVAIYDVDSKIPNLALMKISAWHKSQGDSVEMYSPLFQSEYDKIYASKIFNFSDGSMLNPEKMVIGGTGYDMKKELPEEIEDMVPDYSIYNYPHNIGFTMRGCRLKCSFCVVPEKEGKPYGVMTIPKIWTQRDSDFLIYSIDQARGRGERVSYQDGKAYRQAMARRERRTELNIKQVIL